MKVSVLRPIVDSPSPPYKLEVEIVTSMMVDEPHIFDEPSSTFRSG